MDAIAILDFGSQYSQLIARRVREAKVYCELFPYHASPEEVMSLNPKGFILSGGPASVYEPDAPLIPSYVLESALPILGICYGMQALTYQLGGVVASASQREYGPADLHVLKQNPLISGDKLPVWMSHGDRILHPPAGFDALASTENAPHAAFGDKKNLRFGLQFHPEVQHTPSGAEILRNFVVEICKAQPIWTPPSIIKDAIQRIRTLVKDQSVIAAVSGGVDSTVAASIVHQAIGDQLTCVFVDTGMLRSGEPEAVIATFKEIIGARLLAINASEIFLEALQGVSNPERKREIIGEKFIRIFEEQAHRASDPEFLVQGTIYPDVVESSATGQHATARIKTHHNVGGLPTDLKFQVVEPLRNLFKDEVRKVGAALGLPESTIWRQPFPGPGLAIRCLGEVTLDRLNRLRAADKILLDELGAAGLLREDTAQAFVVLLPVRSVGVMGDQRTYAETAAVRAVTTEDFMTADWARLPYDLLARISTRIVNEVPGINRVVYDISSKPPATIEWE
jgi:GMP synthase (glutamine-hydrolysing)